MNPNLKGNVAEAAINFRALEAGIEVLRPQGEHVRYDLAFDLGARIVRVQCKWARRKGEVIIISLATSRHTPLNGYVKTTYSAREVDAIAAYCHDLDRCYLIPIEKVDGCKAVQLRLSPARNNQLAAVNSAADYEFPGAVAQLEEHLRGTQGVVGSSPISSIADDLPAVGAEKFGMHAPRYVQRAAAGEAFLITRRGRPMARLVPADE